MAQFIAIDPSTSLPAFPTSVYGELYEASDASPRLETIVTADTYQGWKFATAGSLRGFTADTSDATADHLTVPVGFEGAYRIEYNVTLETFSVETQTAKLQVYINGAAQSKTIVRTRRDSTANAETLNSVSVIDLVGGDEISLYWTMNGTDGVSNVEFATVSLTAVRMGP